MDRIISILLMLLIAAMPAVTAASDLCDIDLGLISLGADLIAPCIGQVVEDHVAKHPEGVTDVVETYLESEPQAVEQVVSDYLTKNPGTVEAIVTDYMRSNPSVVRRLLNITLATEPAVIDASVDGYLERNPAKLRELVGRGVKDNRDVVLGAFAGELMLGALAIVLASVGASWALFGRR